MGVADHTIDYRSHVSSCEIPLFHNVIPVWDLWSIRTSKEVLGHGVDLYNQGYTGRG